MVGRIAAGGPLARRRPVDVRLGGADLQRADAGFGKCALDASFDIRLASHGLRDAAALADLHAALAAGARRSLEPAAFETVGGADEADDRGHDQLVDAPFPPLAEQQREVDRLRHEQGDADEQRELARKAARAQAFEGAWYQSRVTSAASV